ncbi:MAG: uracil phosphoribosyltransferase [Bacteroidetes bacterium]|jgi:uracil phosphoribosyltransferase|nr:uracil phosphoribosyltransferase [Bacteroidota bacterium]MCL5034950.1 uracil phosphoribosyltransferase [Bacteroidota bacterium]
MNNLHVIDHPLVKRDVSLLRAKSTTSEDFRIVLRRLTSIMVYEVTKDIRLDSHIVETPLEKTDGFTLADEVILVPVLRAGLGMLEAYLGLLPNAKVGHVGVYRDEATLKPVDYYAKFPPNLSQSVVILIDPMLATGGSASAAISYLEERDAKNIRLNCVVAAPEGVALLEKEHPKVRIYAAVLDRALNKSGYIVPGLGDAGDRIYGT